ncbi:hypothetical protein CcrColossus_gp054 [Caulobacter phage CcrColossus]|uniref:Uncharacterized protein n=1 Tax=Caulobacter phage CcrColossus TaxID=1211640 RepID=K4JRJ2_9CAUD|nr:hypothetical protein CcrColossus_gp054 [Caulobacter phage CcrColossus]AFU87924.1 hypothetical protein CcrColossus_gp054 [Caulobacter phage CcrColossus]
MKVLSVFVATYNERGLEKFKMAGVRPQGKQLVFFEESEKTASMFFRLYTRNLYAIELSKSEFSLYQPNPTPPSSLGFLSDLDETQNLSLNPGLADGSI